MYLWNKTKKHNSQKLKNIRPTLQCIGFLTDELRRLQQKQRVFKRIAKKRKKYCITTAYLCSSPGPWRPHTSGNAGCLQLDHVSLQSLSQAPALPQQPSDQEALWLSNSDKPYEEQIKVTIKKETKRTRRNVGCYGYIQVIVIADG